jgi:hypothetical protein
LLANDESFSPEEAEFFLESATSKEMEMLEEGGYDLQAWEEKDDGSAEVKEINSDGYNTSILALLKIQDFRKYSYPALLAVWLQSSKTRLGLYFLDN